MAVFLFKIGDLCLDKYQKICGGFCGYKDPLLSSILNNVISKECYQVIMYVYLRVTVLKIYFITFEHKSNGGFGLEVLRYVRPSQNRFYLHCIFLFLPFISIIIFAVIDIKIIYFSQTTTQNVLFKCFSRR